MIVQTKKKKVPDLRFPEFEGEWEEKRFGNVFKFLRTNSYSRNQLNYEKGEVKNIHYGDIHTKFKTCFDSSQEKVPFINDEIDLSRITDNDFCRLGDVIFADASEDYKDIGKAIEIVKLDTDKLVAGLHTILARDYKNLLALGFKGFLLQSRRVRLQIMTFSAGAKVLGISKTNLAEINICFPSLPEQQKIADFLTSIDTRIQQLSRKVDLLEDYKKGVMQQIFSQQIRFKDDQGKDYPDWEERKVGDLFEVTRGNVLAVSEMASSKQDSYQYPVYSSQTKQNGLCGYYNEYLYEDAITWTTDGANAGDTKYRKGKFYCTNVCGVLLSDEGYANQFIAEKINAVSKRYVSYVGNPKLMNNVMKTIKILIPTEIEEQQKIAEFLEAIDQKIELTQQQRDQMQEYKKGLLQQMFV